MNRPRNPGESLTPSTDQDAPQPSTLSRRDALKAIALAGAASAGAGLPASAAAQSPSASAPAPCGTTVAASASQAIVETNCGKIRGLIRNGVFTHKGIPYGAPIGRSARFQPAVKPSPWSNVRTALQYGPCAPQERRAGWAIDRMAFLFDWDDGHAGEDCLRLNVWSPGINDGAKRPVMVWFHGGGFVAGSSQELPSYDGERLARRGDVVVVSVNHRLGVLGHLNLAKLGGEKYARSANVGILDLVLSLEWVRDNIAGFGGDPGNVTIFGQSGGGGKVTALMAMPAAKGLFHKAIVQSGSILRMASPERTEKLAEATLAELGVEPGKLGRLHEIEADDLVKAASAALKKTTAASTGAIDIKNFSDRMGWAPTMDGETIPCHPFDPDAPAISSAVPMMAGTTLDEFASAGLTPASASMSDADLLKRVAALQGEKAAAIVAAVKQATPQANNLDLFWRISTAPVRQAAVWQCERKAAQDAAPAYLYWFKWRTPVLDGEQGSFHCLELPFVFDNIDRCANMTGGGEEARALAAKMSEAWIHFARTGDPNHSGLPKWDPFTDARCPTMIFDNECVAPDNPDTAERKAIFG